MGLFDRFRRKPSPSTPQTADQLLRTLFDALHDTNQLRVLCDRHAAEIAQHVPAWQKVPIEIRSDPKRAGEHIQRLIALAEFLDRQMGQPALLRQLQGPAEDNPVRKFQAQMQQAMELADEFRVDEAVNLLSDLLIETRNLQMGGSYSPRGMVHGQLAAILFNGGRPAEALAHFKQALAFCTDQEDTEGVRAYHAALYENHRYLNQPEEAAGHADALAGLYQASGQSKLARRQIQLARIARAGEPLNRVVAVIGDETIELDELSVPIEGRLKFVFARNRMALGNSERMVKRTGAAHAADQDDDALDQLRQAAKVDPFNPNLHYQMGLILLKLQRFGQAVEAYEKTEELAPGWFHVRSDLWLARHLELGRFEHALFMGTWLLADGDAAPAEKRKLAEQLLARFPGVPLLHLLHGEALAAMGLSLEAIGTLRAGLAADPEPDVHTRLLVQLAQMIDDRGERRELLTRAMELNGNLVAGAMARVMLQVP